MTSAPVDLAGFTPVRVAWQGSQPIVDWCFTEGVDFVDPFFDQTVDRCFADPYRLLFRPETAMADLAGMATDAEPPSGFVFHSSRCGSTLVAQMLARLPRTLVMAEPGPLDTILRARQAHPGVCEAQQVQWFRWMVAALGRDRPPGVHYVIKLDAWATLSLPLIARAFPGVPTIFLYREPVEVLVSQLRVRGFHMIPGALPPESLGLGFADVANMAPEEYVAAVLGRLLEEVARLDTSRLPLLVDYRELPDAVADRIAPHLDMPVAPGDRQSLLVAATRDAKNSFLAFTADCDTKHRSASVQLRRHADKWCRPWYDALEELRTKMPSGGP